MTPCRWMRGSTPTASTQPTSAVIDRDDSAMESTRVLKRARFASTSYCPQIGILRSYVESNLPNGKLLACVEHALSRCLRAKLIYGAAGPRVGTRQAQHVLRHLLARRLARFDCLAGRCLPFGKHERDRTTATRHKSTLRAPGMALRNAREALARRLRSVEAARVKARAKPASNPGGSAIYLGCWPRVLARFRRVLRSRRSSL
jgi:hypothetical protein